MGIFITALLSVAEKPVIAVFICHAGYRPRIGYRNEEHRSN
jgi:hypothetical protein